MPLSRHLGRLIALGLVSLGAGCAADVAHTGDEASVAAGETGSGKADFVASGALWPSARIAVCWESDADAYAVERAWVEDAIRDTWSAVSAVELTGWGPCPRGAPGIHIGVTDAAPNTLGLGTELDGVDYGMRLNFEFATWSPGCQSTREACIRAGAAHEVGHALGFAHEQNRRDTPGWCAGERGAFGDLSFTDWDLDSIMNYCNPEWTGGGDLSASDIVAVRALYGRDPGTVVVARSDGGTLAPEWVLAEDATLAARGRAVVIHIGDATGDGRDDVIAFDPSGGEWLVLESAGDRSLPARSFASRGTRADVVTLVADTNGDGLADAIAVEPSGDWSVGLSDGARFGSPTWIGRFDTTGTPLAADVDDDGRDDAIVVDAQSGRWWVARSVGTGLGAPELLLEGHGAGARAHFARDVTGDGRADLVAASDPSGTWWVAPSSIDGSPTYARWAEAHGAAADDWLLADLGGDGRADAVVYERARGRWFARSSTGSAFSDDSLIASTLATSLARVQPTVRTGDIDGDGDDDVLLLW